MDGRLSSRGRRINSGCLHGLFTQRNTVGNIFWLWSLLLVLLGAKTHLKLHDTKRTHLNSSIKRIFGILKPLLHVQITIWNTPCNYQTYCTLDYDLHLSPFPLVWVSYHMSIQAECDLQENAILPPRNSDQTGHVSLRLEAVVLVRECNVRRGGKRPRRKCSINALVCSAKCNVYALRSTAVQPFARSPKWHWVAIVQWKWEIQHG